MNWTWLGQPRQDKNLFYWHEKPNELTKEGLLSYVLSESPFISVSTVSRGQLSLVSLEKHTSLRRALYLPKRGRGPFSMVYRQYCIMGNFFEKIKILYLARCSVP